MAFNTANAFLQGNSETVREDLDGLITIMTPADMPLISTLGSESVSAVNYDWIMDEFATPTSVVSEIEGAEATFPTQTPPQRIGSYTNIVEEAFSVSDTSREVNEAGFDDTYRYYAMKNAVKVLKQSEFNAHYAQVGATAPAAGAARQTHGVFSWLFWTGTGDNAGEDITIAGHVVPEQYGSVIADPGNSSLSVFNKDHLVDSLLNPCWANGMQIDQSMLFCGGAVKKQLSTFGQVYASAANAATEAINRRNISASSRRIIDTIDWYESDFGTIAMNLDRYMTTAVITYTMASAFSTTQGETDVDTNASLFVIEPRMWKTCYLRGLSHVPLAKIGDSSNGQIIVEFGIKCCNPLAGGMLYNMSA